MNPKTNKNNIDLLWEAYLASKDKADYQKLIAFIREIPSAENTILESYFFGETISSLSFALKEFFIYGNTDRLARFSSSFSKLSNTHKSLHAELLCRLWGGVQEISTSDIEQSTVNKLVSELGVLPARIQEIFEILNYSNEAKLDIIEHQNFPDLFAAEGSISLRGTLVFDASFICGHGRVQKGLFFFVSLCSPLDGVYFPTNGILLKSTQCGFTLKDKAEKTLKHIIKNISFFIDFIERDYLNNPLEICQFIKDKRPFHVLGDELSGAFFLGHDCGKKYRKVFAERASFLEPDVLKCDVLDPNNAQEYGRGKILFSSFKRLNNLESWCTDYCDWLKEMAVKYYSSQMFAKQNQEKIIWLGIAGGEKRFWKEEVEGLVAVIHWAREKFPGCKFVFDGWTTTTNLKEVDIKNIEQHNAIYNKILSISELDPSACKTTIGGQIFKKIALASQCDFFVSAAGTPAVWPSLVCKLPGVVHNNKIMVKDASTIRGATNIVRVPDNMITDIKDNMRKDRRDFISYSIKPSDLVACCEMAREKFMSEDRAN